jgi:hypothetical protein
MDNADESTERLGGSAELEFLIEVLAEGGCAD